MLAPSSCRQPVVDQLWRRGQYGVPVRSLPTLCGGEPSYPVTRRPQAPTRGLPTESRSRTHPRLPRRAEWAGNSTPALRPLWHRRRRPRRSKPRTAARASRFRSLDQYASLRPLTNCKSRGDQRAFSTTARFWRKMRAITVVTEGPPVFRRTLSVVAVAGMPVAVVLSAGTGPAHAAAQPSSSRCGDASLHLTLRYTAAQTGGRSLSQFGLRNRSSNACTLRGFAGLQFLRDGRRLPTDARHLHQQVRVVRVLPGRSAYFEVFTSSSNTASGTCSARMEHATAVKVTAPRSNGAALRARLRSRNSHGLEVCGDVTRESPIKQTERTSG